MMEEFSDKLRSILSKYSSGKCDNNKLMLIIGTKICKTTSNGNLIESTFAYMTCIINI